MGFNALMRCASVVSVIGSGTVVGSGISVGALAGRFRRDEAGFMFRWAGLKKVLGVNERYILEGKSRMKER